MKKTMVWVVLFALICFSAGLMAQAKPEKKLSKEATQLLKDCQTAFQAKDLAKAVELLKKVIVLEPDYAPAHYNLGIVENQAGNVDQAIIHVNEAIKLKPDYEQAKRGLNVIYYEAGHKANADKEYAKSNDYFMKFLAATTPDGEYKTAVIDAYSKVAFNYFSLKNYPDSAEYFKKCLAVPGLETEKPDLFANCYYFLGMNAHAMMEYTESRDYFQKYIELFKGKETESQFIGNAHYFVGINMLRLLEKRIEAKETSEQIATAAKEIIPILTKAMDMQVQLEDAYIALGNTYIHARDFENAKKVYGQVIDRYPQSPNVAQYKKLLTDLDNQIKARDEAAKKPAARTKRKATAK